MIHDRSHSILFSFWAATLVFGLLVATGDALAGTPGSRPREVAVSPDGQVVITTSEGSNQITIIDNGQKEHLAISTDPEDHSWGVCFVANRVAIVTVPTRTSLARVEYDTAIQQWKATEIGSIGYYCTEVIPSPNSGKVLVANRGSAPVGEAAWKHGVYEVNHVNGGIEQTYVTERQPRSLAVSSDGEVLYVGHVVGDMGVGGIGTNFRFGSDPTTLPLDGGCVISYDLDDGGPIDRFPIGSPVRGLAVWPPQGTQGVDHHYLYFTHVGMGAQGEALHLGGRLNPNVVSAIRFDSQNAPQTRVDAIVDHAPGADASAGNPGAILHDKLVVRDGPPLQLWVSNSASGTVTRINLIDGDGAFSVQQAVPDFDLLDFKQTDLIPGEMGLDRPSEFKVLTIRPENLIRNNMADASQSNIRYLFKWFDAPKTIIVDPATPPSPRFSSNPRGIAYDGVNERVLVATYLDHELVEIDATTELVTARQTVLNGTAPTSAAERNFFTSGEGFEFRESAANTKVNTLSCGTCHVDGHIDGKIRMTPTDNDQPAAVPSVFDMGDTEWMFMDGLMTILDNFTGCVYCEEASFFDDTIDFTSGARSPRSPHSDRGLGGADDGLTASQLVGRAWFDQLNCSRCHAGPVDQFKRTVASGVPGSEMFGPLNNSGRAERLLHDPTQVFISNCPPGGCPEIGGTNEPDVALRNSTEVGTKPARTFNTPALAGAWDNSPYMHDGRYRDLDGVLTNTWVMESSCEYGEGFFAAPLWECMEQGPIPDNWSNALNLSDPSTADTYLPPFTFDTHRSARPTAPPGSNWRSVRQYLQADLQNPDAYASLKDFILALSSHTDPCAGPGLTISGVSDSYDSSTKTTTVSWTTSYPVSCDGVWGELGIPNSEFETPIGIDHQIELVGLCPSLQFQIDIDAKRRRGVCVEQEESVTHSWSPPGNFMISDIQQTPELDCSQNVITWTTNAAVSCRVEWGLRPGRGGWNPTVINTPVGTSHQVALSTVPGQRYEARIFASCGVQQDQETENWNTFVCATMKTADGGDKVSTGIVGVSPNPFNPQTSIVFGLAKPGEVSLKVYDAAGRLVRTLASGTHTAGTHEVIWNGRSDGGGRTASGVYFLRMETPSLVQNRKLVLVE